MDGLIGRKLLFYYMKYTYEYNNKICNKNWKNSPRNEMTITIDIPCRVICMNGLGFA